MNHKINKLLIANRTEIALRIKRAADTMGISVVGVASIVDEHQSFAKQFDELAILDGSSAADSYLAIHKILSAARRHGCDAIHPGYGFLSENAAFAHAVEESGLIFVGPRAKTIELLGSKTSARALAKKLKVPVVPGTLAESTNAALVVSAKKMKLPLLIKAVAGGGGRGMRIVRKYSELEAELSQARAEAKKFFSDEAVFIERYIENPRHVEVQLFGDSSGTVVHFGTRDCSAQRRYQKIIEEAPAPFISIPLRRKIEAAAIKIAKAAKYVGAGTAEFIVKGNEFFFLEINTRIQVEHPVTEQAYGIDLVQLQLQIAQGGKLPKALLKKAPSQYSVEVRVYAEDSINCTPSLGTIENLSLPRYVDVGDEQVRFDFGYQSGDRVSPFYDAMLGKVIVTGSKRLATIDRACAVLDAIQISGVETNISFAKKILEDLRFRDGSLSIQNIDSDLQSIREGTQQPEDARTFRHLQKEDFKPIEYIGKKSGVRFTIALEYQSPFFIARPMVKEKGANSPTLLRKSLHPEIALSALRNEVLDRLTKPQVLKSFSK